MKKTMKRFVSAMLLASLFLFCCAPAYAEDAPGFNAHLDVSGGDDQVSVSIPEENEEVLMQLEPKLKLVCPFDCGVVTAPDGTVIPAAWEEYTVSFRVAMAGTFTVTRSTPLTVALEIGEGRQETVSVPKGGAVGELPVPVRKDYGFDGWFTEEGMPVDPGMVLDEDSSFFAHWHLCGDVNGDGSVSTKDFVALMKFLAGEDLPVQQTALDVNGDGRISTKDFVTLMKYLAGEEISIY